MSPERKKLILALAIIFAVNIFIIALAQRASADLYKKGSGGAVVTEIQTRLKNWGYYFGAVDGVYGSQTEKAVRWFQEKNGLTADGQVGDQTLAALGMPSGGGTSSGGKIGGSGGSGSLDLLARLISAEARGEPYEGQVAVGAVVLNRTRSTAGTRATERSTILIQPPPPANGSGRGRSSSTSASTDSVHKASAKC